MQVLAGTVRKILSMTFPVHFSPVVTERCTCKHSFCQLQVIIIVICGICSSFSLFSALPLRRWHNPRALRFPLLVSLLPISFRRLNQPVLPQFLLLYGHPMISATRGSAQPKTSPTISNLLCQQEFCSTHTTSTLTASMRNARKPFLSPSLPTRLVHLSRKRAGARYV